MHGVNLILNATAWTIMFPSLFPRGIYLLPHGKKNILTFLLSVSSHRGRSQREAQTWKIIPHFYQLLWHLLQELSGHWCSSEDTTASPGDFIRNLCHCFSVQRAFIVHLYKYRKQKTMFTSDRLQGARDVLVHSYCTCFVFSPRHRD